VLGDSKLLIDWANSKCQITNLALRSIIQKILEVKSLFDHLAFSHIYREFNTKAYYLSKGALPLQEGSLLSQEFRRAELLYENLVSVL
jgi:hypothetical protein